MTVAWVSHFARSWPGSVYRALRSWHRQKITLFYIIIFLLYLLQTCLYNMSTTNRPSGVWTLSCMYVLITDRWQSVKQFALIIACSACCLVISLGVQCDIVNFVWLSIVRPSALADILGYTWCCPSRLCLVFLACLHLALFLALSLSTCNSLGY